MSTYPLHAHVDRHGNIFGARNAPKDAVSIGLWDVSQMRYRPFINAVNRGVDEARTISPSRRPGKFSEAQFRMLPICQGPRPANPKTIEAARLHLVGGMSISGAARMVGWHRKNVYDAMRAMYARLANNS